VLAAALLGLAAPVSRPAPEPGPPPAAPARPGFVARAGGGFVLDGAPFRFVGVNLYNAAGDPRIYECGSTTADPDADLDSWYAGGFRRPYGGYPLSYAEYVRRVLRFWAFQSYTAGGTDWRRSGSTPARRTSPGRRSASASTPTIRDGSCRRTRWRGRWRPPAGWANRSSSAKPG
jgi:hypothetical protein